ncbi:MAG: ABC transporter permease [Acidimicrobiales bacterium]|jgi:putative spermidine/putrescine transport system permease protein
MKLKGRGWGIFWLVVGALYLLVPLYGMAQFSLETGPHSYGFHWYQTIFDSSQFRSSFLLSLRLALETVAISLVLLVPTVFWVHLRLPRLRPLFEFLVILPFVVPPVALAVGLVGLFRPVTWLVSTPELLAFVYVILALPFSYRSLDAGMRAIDLRTLSQAAESLGARWTTTLRLVVLPNVRSSLLGASFLTLAIVMGEFTIASLLLFNTFPVYIEYIGETKAYPAAALALISFVLTWGAMLGMFIVGRGRGRTHTEVAMTR